MKRYNRFGGINRGGTGDFYGNTSPYQMIKVVALVILSMLFKHVEHLVKVGGELLKLLNLKLLQVLTLWI